MALDVGVAAGQVDIVIDVALGTSSCSFNPMDAAGQILKVAKLKSLQEATIAAGICEQILIEIQETVMNRLPLMCELIRLGQLFPHDQRVGDNNLNQALQRCFQSVCAALHEARTAMNRYLRSNRLSQMTQAPSIKEAMTQMQTRLTNRLNDVSAYVQLAILLRQEQSTEQAQHTAAIMDKLNQQVKEMVRLRSADKARVRAIAKAALERQAPQGQNIRLNKKGIKHLDVSPCGDMFVTLSGFDVLTVWDAATGTIMHEHIARVRSVAWSPDGSRLATGSEGTLATVWDAVTGIRTHELQSHAQERFAGDIAWSPDGSRLAAALGERPEGSRLALTVAVWEAATGVCMHVLQGLCWSETVAWSPDGSRLATITSTRDGAVVWDVATGTRMRELRGIVANPFHVRVMIARALTWSPDGGKVAAVSVNWQSTVVWDAVSGDMMHDLGGYCSFASTVMWSPDGSKIATTHEEEEMCAIVWDVATRTRLHELKGDVQVRAIAWSLDGSKLATGSDGGRATVWDANSGKAMHDLQSGTRRIHKVVWSPMGGTLYTVSNGYGVGVHDVAALSNGQLGY